MEQRRKIVGVIASSILKSADPFLVSATVEDADPTDIVMVFNENVTGTNLGFTIGGTTSTAFASISGSGTDTITGVLAVAVAFGETVTLSYNDAVGDLVDDDTNPVASFTDTAVTNNVGDPLLEDLKFAFSLRKVYDDWTRACLRVERSSDSARKYVFFDGSDTISTSSFVSDNNSTPSATTFGDWATTDNVEVVIWYAQQAGNIISENVSNTANFPRIMTGGVIITENSLPAIAFDGTEFFRDTSGFSIFDSGNSFSIVSVSVNSVNNSFGVICSNTNNETPRFLLANHRQGTIIVYLRNATTDHFADYSGGVQNHGNQKLLTAVITATDIDVYYDGAFQENVSWTGAYTNSWFRIGNQLSDNTDITGTIQEVLCYEADKISDLATIHSNVNTYYTIY